MSKDPPDRRRWLPNYPDPAPGQWVAYDYGKDQRGWHLTCGGMFHADIFFGSSRYNLTLNMHPIAQGADPDALMLLAERHIVARVRKMRAAYKAIYGRVRAVDEAKGTVAVTVRKGDFDAHL